MAASDQTYRNQKTLDIVFAVSCVAMLITTVWMFVQDFNRDYKKVQREFRNVEEAMAERAVLDFAPDAEKLGEIVKAEQDVAKAKQELDAVKAEHDAVVNRILPDKIKAEDRYRGVKADYDSLVSLYDIAVDKLNAVSSADQATRNRLIGEVKRLEGQVRDLKDQLDRLKDEQDQKIEELNQALAPIQAAEGKLSAAEDGLKKLTGDFDRFHRLAEQKRWGWGDDFRRLPILDAFASPIRIQQTVLEDLPINYSFKYVTRYDRCTTCHLGIDRAAYGKDALLALTQPPTDTLKQKLASAQEALKKRKEIRPNEAGLDPGSLQLQQVPLTASQITQYAAHPRLDLFVDGNSPHGAEKFGCTICHGGQGSGTDFYGSSHTPNDARQTAQWRKDHHWHSNHYWDYPMLPNRFIESSCVKCHYQMTDLIRDGSRVEAPKLMRGYNLVKDNGCFGCHEIAGIKGGRWVGPDLRLEPTPPLDAYTPAERARLTSDPLTPVGTERKVGPSLRRLSEKTNYDWVVNWVRSPRDFRPDTKMPHFYGLSNNHPDVLPADQKDFPATEIHALAAFLMSESSSYLKGSDKFRLTQEARQKDLQQFAKDGTISEPQQRELEEVTRRLERNVKPQPLADLPAKFNEKPTPEQLYRGRELFSERGCLACHQHEGTQQTLKGPDKLPTLPAITGEALFGPNLSRLAGKLGVKPGDQVSARKWLVRWIMDPAAHHPRTKMPVTHLTLEEANDVASWLLAQPVKDYTPPEVPAPDLRMLKELARVYLTRAFTRREVEDILEKGLPSQWFVDNKKPLDADERELETASGEAKPMETKLKMYVGKKAIGQLGCYACHDIPGFENAKPIGTPLNDWGMKDAERLAFEDAVSFVNRTFAIVPKLTDDKGKPVQVTKKGPDGNPLPPYEKFFFDLLEHHQREGFLHQKLTEPRSYDYDRIRAWDDRLRMPQFKFARTERNADESDEAFAARQNLEEARGREDVMTFILGLVAEPIPPKFVHNPAPEKLAEIKGRQILDKYNCNGCHLVRPGVYEFSPLAPAPTAYLDTPKATALDQLKRTYANAERDWASDHIFPNSNIWVGLPSPRPDRLVAYGLLQSVQNDDDESKPFQAVQLTQALRFHVKEDGKTAARDIPAYTQLLLPFQLAVPPGQAYGGTFADLLTKYLTEKDRQKYKDDATARPAVPPALLRQGEKTQPLWLFNFLRQPHEIRPVTVLRMPRFNMSEDEAMALVNYFAAVDKMSNPAAGLAYPYLTIHEREDSYIEKMTSLYVERLNKDKVFDQRAAGLKPLWESSFNAVKAQLTAAEAKLKEAEEQVKKLQEDEKKEEDKDKKKQLEDMRKKAEEARDFVKRDVDRLKVEAGHNDVAALQKRWATQEAWLIDGFKPLVSDTLCLNCHQIGSYQPKEKQGPPLDLTWHRLRPEWTLQWLANPQRYMTYKTPMPQNFPRNSTVFQELIRGTSLEQVTGVRDALINYPKVIDMPANRSRPVTVVGGGK